MSHCTFHLSLNVPDLSRTALFLETLLGAQAAAVHPDYVKFELSDPPLVLSLIPSDVPGGGLNHLGFRLSSRAALDELERRLDAVGIPYDSEVSVACCHSRQTKLWVQDPAGNHWELYVLEDSGQCANQPVVKPPESLPLFEENEVAEERPLASWKHRLGDPFPSSISAAADSLDEIFLEGTFNAVLASDEMHAILTATATALQPGGRLLVHGLTADRPLKHPPKLPGPAAAVQAVPTCGDLLHAVKKAGFVGLELSTFGETYCFTHAGSELRETRLVAWKALDSAPIETCWVIYRGPFEELRDDSGHVFRRGARVPIDDATRKRLEASTDRERFVFLSGTSSHEPLVTISLSDRPGTLD